VQFLRYLEQPFSRPRMGLAGHVADGQTAARHHRVPEPPHDPPRVFLVPQAAQHADEHDPDRLIEVEQTAHPLVAEHLLRLAQVRSERDHVGAGYQRGRMGGHDGIDVHVDHARIRVDTVGDLVGVGHARKAGAKVQELADALPEQVVHHPLEQMAALNGGVLAGRCADLAHHRIARLGRLPVDLVVVLAAELVIPDAGGVGIPEVDRILGIQFGGCWPLG
jgi:hypothetical protein